LDQIPNALHQPCLLALMMNYKTTRFKPICLLKPLIVVRIVIVNGILETHGLPAFSRGMPVLLLK
jgi:hypothetical protein